MAEEAKKSDWIVGNDYYLLMLHANDVTLSKMFLREEDKQAPAISTEHKAWIKSPLIYLSAAASGLHYQQR